MYFESETGWTGGFPPLYTVANPDEPSAVPTWTFLSNHAHVLVCLARDRDVRLRDVAEQVGVTERSVVKIVNELEEAGVVTRTRVGRRNHYEINPSITLRHPLESTRTVGSLLEMVLDARTKRELGLRRGNRDRSAPG